jgi:RecG-like helicase
MKKSILLVASVAAFVLAATTTRTFAEDKEITISGDGKCAKCALKETEKCQNVIQTKKDGKEVTYYFVKNEVSEKFHENLCKDSKKVTATGTVKEVNGKKEFTAKKIELAEAESK